MPGRGRDVADTQRMARPTTADVARLADVSTATVSYVLNNAEGRRISDRTREAVHLAARQLGYRPNLAARNLASGRSGAVLYIVPHDAMGNMPLQAGGRMTTELARAGLLQVQIFDTGNDSDVVDAMADIDPVAITSLFPLSRAVGQAIEEADIPHIVIGALPALGQPHLTVGEMRIEHLVARGHRRIAYAYTGIKRQRALGDYWFDGVAGAATARGLDPIRTADVTKQNAADVVASWAREGVTAVCAQSDDVAFVVLHGIREAGLRCPDDLAVIGVDATPLSAVSTPSLTTVEFDFTAVADVAISALLDRLGRPTSPPPQPSDISRLIVGEST